MDPEKTILFVLAQDEFNDFEYETPKRLLVEAGFNVEIASAREGECRGFFGTLVASDFEFVEIDPENYCAVIFVGGPGAKALSEQAYALGLAQKFFEGGKLIGALAEGPIVLLEAGVLKQGDKATIWRTFKDLLLEKGVEYTGETVTVNGNIITANAQEAAEEFTQKLLGLIV